MEKINILIADDHLLVRQGIRNLINNEDNLNVIGEAIDGFDTVQKTLEFKPDILLLDINMPNMNGFEALEKIKNKNPFQKVIILSIHDSLDYIKESLRLGADGYVSKGVGFEVLKDAILRVHDGDIYLQPTIFKSKDIDKFILNNHVKEKNQNNLIPIDIREILTPREFEVIKEIGMGKRNKEIAVRLNISEKTVRNHMYNIFKKLNITDRTQAAIIVTQYNSYYK